MHTHAPALIRAKLCKKQTTFAHCVCSDLRLRVPSAPTKGQKQKWINENIFPSLCSSAHLLPLLCAAALVRILP